MSSSLTIKVRRRLRDRLSGMSLFSRTTPPPPPVRGSRQWKYLKPHDVKGLKNMLFAARTIVEGHYAGRHKSPYKGSAPDFVDYRPYAPGDSMRSIDWKAYARTDRYMIRLYEKETDMSCQILVDASGSMEFGGPYSGKSLPKEGLSKLEYACYLAGALTYLMVKQGDKVGLTVFDEDIRGHLPPGGTFGHMYKVLGALEKTQAGNQTSLATTLKKASGLCKQRGLLVVISDFLDDHEELFKALNIYTHRGFEIILFHMMHEYEYHLPPIAHANFVDAETGEMLTCLPGDIRAEYEKELEGHIETLRGLSRARRIDYNFLSTETPYSVALQKYLLRRSSLRM